MRTVIASATDGTKTRDELTCLEEQAKQWSQDCVLVALFPLTPGEDSSQARTNLNSLVLSLAPLTQSILWEHQVPAVNAMTSLVVLWLGS